jgi:hypothetical protein
VLFCVRVCLRARRFGVSVHPHVGSPSCDSILAVFCGAWHKILTYSRCDTSVYIPCAVMRTVPCTCVLEMVRKRRGGERAMSERIHMWRWHIGML